MKSDKPKIESWLSLWTPQSQEPVKKPKPKKPITPSEPNKPIDPCKQKPQRSQPRKMTRLKELAAILRASRH